MATHPVGTLHIQPPCWPSAVPWLVSVLPVSAINGFRILEGHLRFFPISLAFAFLHWRQIPGVSYLGLLARLRFADRDAAADASRTTCDAWLTAGRELVHALFS
jgi:hypothetical protein